MSAPGRTVPGMATYRPFHLLECPARDGAVSLDACTCPLWRFLDPGSRLDETADVAAEIRP